MAPGTILLPHAVSQALQGNSLIVGVEIGIGTVLLQFDPDPDSEVH